VHIRLQRRERERGNEGTRERGNKGVLELDLAGGEGLVLHDDGAAGGQDHDVELLLPLVGLLVPLTGHLRVVGRDQGHLGGRGERSGNVPGEGGV